MSMHALLFFFSGRWSLQIPQPSQLMFFEDCQIPGWVFLLLHPPKRILEDDEWTIHICLRIYMGNYTKSSWDIYLFSPICLDSLVNSMDSKLDWSHFSLNFLPRQIWKTTTQLLFVVRNACCFFPMWRKSKCVDLFHGDLCMGPHTHFKGKEVALFGQRSLTSEVKPPKSQPKRPPHGYKVELFTMNIYSYNWQSPTSKRYSLFFMKTDLAVKFVLSPPKIKNRP